MELKVGKTLIGRMLSTGNNATNEYRWTLIDKTVSRTHVEITLSDPGVPVLTHISETNDTFIGRRKIDRENLQEGQIFEMGQTAILMEAKSKFLKIEI